MWSYLQLNMMHAEVLLCFADRFLFDLPQYNFVIVINHIKYNSPFFASHASFHLFDTSRNFIQDHWPSFSHHDIVLQSHSTYFHEFIDDGFIQELTLDRIFVSFFKEVLDKVTTRLIGEYHAWF